MTMTAGPSSGPAVHTGPSSGQDGPTKRLRTGCHTCRIRKKRCDEAKPHCASCTRLGIECLGYGAKRPEWLKQKGDVEITAAQLKQKISEGRTKRQRTESYPPRQSSVPDLASSSESLEPETTHEVDEPDYLQRQSWQTGGLVQTVTPLNLNGFNPSSDFASTSFDPSIPTDFAVGTSLPLERDIDEMWRVLFGEDNPFSIPLSLPAPAPGFIAGIGSPDKYLHHYLNIVLPQQFHHKQMGLGDIVAQLAMTHPDVLDAVSSLAALHMGAQRTRQLCAPADNDVIYAQAAHRKTIDRLRLIAVEDFPTEQIVILAIFATSFQLFSGGTAKMWRESIAVCQRCLSTILARFGDHLRPNVQQYPVWMPHLIWVDVVSSVSKNTGSRLLPTYRKLLLHKPINPDLPGEEVLLEKTMGCDSTTTLALAEIVALSEWKAKAIEAGCLVSRDLLERARPIEQLLEEREWREGHLSTLELKDQLYGDTFFYAAKILLASTIDGPFPSLPDISLAVQKMQTTLQRLDDIVQDVDLARGLVLPITLAGCHAGSASEQAFFKERFARLSPEAAAFGNTRSAQELMEEVWRRRGMGLKSERIEWTHVMLDMGWEAGILLI